jgi:hypothetical protein
LPTEPNQLIKVEKDAEGLISNHPFRRQVLARAVEIALTRRGDGLVTVSDVEKAIEEMETVLPPSVKVAGLCYAIGGAILGVGLASAVANPPILGVANLPLLFISIGGLLLIVLGFVDENY